MFKEIIQSTYPSDYDSEEKLNKVTELTEKLPQDLKDYLIAILEGNDVTEIAVEGYTVGSLMLRHNMNKVAASLTLDYLRRDPKKSFDSLRKGHDVVRF